MSNEINFFEQPCKCTELQNFGTEAWTTPLKHKKQHQDKQYYQKKSEMVILIAFLKCWMQWYSQYHHLQFQPNDITILFNKTGDIRDCLLILFQCVVRIFIQIIVLPYLASTLLIRMSLIRVHVVARLYISE